MQGFNQEKEDRQDRKSGRGNPGNRPAEGSRDADGDHKNEEKCVGTKYPVKDKVYRERRAYREKG
jgi:hypothetical protein